jgi:hypothetical protein
MQWITENWLLILLGGGLITLHLFGHSKHGGKGGHTGNGAKKSEALARITSKSGSKETVKPPDGL